ncbi:MAG: uncharacterized protein KVP18_003935 [Porospora cf. gigantea A]|uniref:uncharacterized protein n=1 Tax=Porospora cf. gigantea A TaxID=2853593 RepID=UPI00355A7E4D|nr:MAG: hypothetical protein KVP18_003935 [Porospora cf. gigantea A]
MAATDSHFERHNVWNARVEKHVARFGVGMQLYFTFLYHLFWVFAGLACLSIPQMIFTSYGNMLEPQAGMSLDMTLLANIGLAPNIGFGLTAGETLRAFMERTTVIAGTTLSVKSCTLVCGVCDVLGVIGVLIWVMWFFKVHTANVVFDNDVRTLDLSDHAIMVTNLPRRIDDHHNYRYHLKEHFEEIALSNPDRDHYVDNGDVRIIHEVSLVRDFEGSFKTILNVGDYHREIDCNRARRYWGMDVPENKNEKLEAKMKASLATVMQKDYKQVHARDVVMAFVTFTSQKDKQFVQSQYSSTRFTLSHHLQPADLRFRGQALSVVTAPEPEDIIWENLDVPYKSRVFRTCGLVAVVALILMLAFFLTWVILVGVVTQEFHSTKNASVVQVLTRQGSTPWKICDVGLYTDYDCTEEIPATSYTWQPFMNDDKWTLTMHKDLHDAGCYESNVTHLVGENVGFQLVHNSPMNIGCLKLRQDNLAGLSKGFTVRMCEEAGDYPVAIGQKVMSCTKAADVFFHEMDESLQAFSLSSWHERDVDNCDLYDDEGLSTNDFLALLQNAKADPDFVDWQANCYCNSNIFKSLLDSSTRKVCHNYIQHSIKAMAVGAACRYP